MPETLYIIWHFWVYRRVMCFLYRQIYPYWHNFSLKIMFILTRKINLSLQIRSNYLVGIGFMKSPPQTGHSKFSFSTILSRSKQYFIGMISLFLNSCVPYCLVTNLRFKKPPGSNAKSAEYTREFQQVNSIKIRNEIHEKLTIEWA